MKPWATHSGGRRPGPARPACVLEREWDLMDMLWGNQEGLKLLSSNPRAGWLSLSPPNICIPPSPSSVCTAGGCGAVQLATDKLATL